jgi:hypothetical protein
MLQRNLVCGVNVFKIHEYRPISEASERDDRRMGRGVGRLHVSPVAYFLAKIETAPLDLSFP